MEIQDKEYLDSKSRSSSDLTLTGYARSILLDNVEHASIQMGGLLGARMYEKSFPERIVHPRAQEKWSSTYFNPMVVDGCIYTGKAPLQGRIGGYAQE